MGKIINITKKDDETYERNRKLLEEAINNLGDAEISSFMLSVETRDGKASFSCAADPSLLTFTQGYLNYLFLDQAHQHIENADDYDLE